LESKGGCAIATDVLRDLGLSLEDLAVLSPRLRSRIVPFLLRWKHYEALDACLIELLQERVLVSLLDARARMLLDQGLLDEAWQTLEARHELRTSLTSRILGVQIQLARGKADQALQTAKSLVKANPDSVTALSLLGETLLAAGEMEAAKAAYQKLGELRADGTSYMLGMMAVYQAEDDWVSASAYAVRAQETATADRPLSVWTLRRLRDYFEASKERNRVADIDGQLAKRQAEELAALQAAIAEELGRARPGEAAPDRRKPRPAEEPAPEPEGALDAFTLVDVPPQERERIRAAAERVFGFGDLLPGQAEIMACAAGGEDVLAVLPTGGGKSLCYQLPALEASSGTTLVVSPLIALMKDQVDKLPQQVQRLATTVNSTLDGDELGRRLSAVKAGRYRLVYAAPERLRQPPFVHALRRAGVNRLVIDEVHCVSMWGHDFRPDYLYLPQARQQLGQPPLLAMTATAAPRVRRDILQRLGQMRIISGEVMRPNLRLEAFRACDRDDKLQYLMGFCASEPGPGIVYGDTRAKCEEVAELLRQQGVSAIHYHAGIPDRNAVQDEFMQGRAQVVVATVAFGMGIDKADIRYIVHYMPPPSLEAYYQEAGRAGRDGLLARCVLMYSSGDRGTLTRRANRGALSREFLRKVYGVVQAKLNGSGPGRLVMDDLRRELRAEEVPLRVALSLLEQVGLLRRWPDVPRSVTLCLRHPAPEDESGFGDFCRAARLVPGQRLARDLLDVARAAGLDAGQVEEQVLSWADEGALDCRGSARDLLVELLPVPADADRRVGQLLEQYEQIQRQRIAEIVSYAETVRCRHGHISAYLGGRIIERCQSCDNCVPGTEPAMESTLPEEATQLRCVLQAAAPGWGRRNLCHILRGSDRAPQSAKGGDVFGALAFRSEAGIGRMVDRLVDVGFLEKRELSHGGVVIKLTGSGRQALSDDSLIQALAERRPKRRGSPAGRQDEGSDKDDPSSAEPEVADDDPLLQRLREWCVQKAREKGLPTYFIFHRAVLRRIVAARPRTEGELRAIRGIGPKKAAEYGAELLALLQDVGPAEEEARCPAD